MPLAIRSVILTTALAVLLGAIVGAYFSQALLGVIVALTGLLVYHLRYLLELERVLRLRKRVRVPDGDGVWARVLAAVRYQQQRVRRHKSRHRQLMKEIRQSTNALPDGVIALNEDNDIQRYNAAAQMLIGLRRRRDRGQRVDNLIRHPDFVNYLARGSFQAPVIIPSPRREDGWLSISMVPYSANSRLLIIRDVTERTRLSRMRRDFVANASHELRTPLTVISGYIDAMYDDAQLRAEWGKPVDEMRRQADRMREMLDELLALSKLEAGAIAGSDKAVDVASLIRETIGLYDAEQLRLRVNIESDALVLGEYSDLSSVISNLVSNALRYSGEGTPVTVHWQPENKGMKLVVEDEGDGIAPQDVPRLTERFFRVNRGRGRDSGGVGLGLAIVKHALARHEATLEIISIENQGSQFICHFPAQRIAAAGVDQDSATSA